MKMLNLLSRSKGSLFVGTTLALAAPFTFAADAASSDIDYTSMIASISAAGLVATIVAMGVIKIGPSFAKWGVNKVAGFFG